MKKKRPFPQNTIDEAEKKGSIHTLLSPSMINSLWKMRNSESFTRFVVLAVVLFIGPRFVQAQKVIININGNWSPWSTVNTPCNASCGGGVMVKVRSCTNPRPQGMEAKECEGIDKEFFPCNEEPCDMQWSTWSDCSANCGRGMRMRHTRCAKEKGGDLFECEGEQYFTHTENCNSWVKDPKICPSPCEGYECMDFGACVDVSTEEDPIAVCECQMGKIFDDSGLECVDPPPTTPTPRPIPTMKPAVKAVTTGMTKTASTLLIIFVTITLVIFAVLRIFDHGRVIQMNMEIALISAHICLLIEPPPEWIEICRLFSILIHMFFTTCFVFMCLEALHTYSLVAFVVKKNGMLTKLQNVAIGWGVGVGITLIVVSLEYKNYGGEYHCWLAMDTTLMVGQFVPIVIMVVLTLTLIEAAGAAEYRKLPGIDQRQQTSAKIMQRSNLIIMPMVFVSFLLGTLSSYEQNPGLYGTFTLVNGILGGSIFFFHSTGNEQVRAKLMKAYKTIIKKEKF